MTECPQITQADASKRQFLPPCTLKRSMVGGRVLLRLLLALAVAIPLAASLGCGGGDEGAGGATQAAQPGQGGQGQRRRPSQPPTPVAIDLARRGDIASYYTATATLTAEKEAQILARATGVALSLHCEEGDWVKAGQTLLGVEEDEYRLRLAQAEANTANLRDRFARLEGMWEQQLVSAEEYESTKNELRAAEAAEELARLNLSYTTVKAPFAGRITSRLVDVGQNVNLGVPLFVIADFDPLLAIVHVPSKEFKKLKPDQNVTIILDSTKQKLEGHIKLVSPVIDPTSGTIKVTVEIPDYPPDTRPGDFAEVSIVTERRRGSVLVPKNAVFTDRGDQVLYVAAADSTAERRVVALGFEDDEHAEIMSGVTEGERIVVKGQRSLKHGAPIKVLEADTVSVSGPAKPQAGP
jgi:membrane fusion protein (multidrug efflux system)